MKFSKEDFEEYIRLRKTIENFRKRGKLKQWRCPRNYNCQLCYEICIIKTQQRIMDLERKYNKKEDGKTC